jgi:hypothetical protein
MKPAAVDRIAKDKKDAKCAAAHVEIEDIASRREAGEY